MANDNNDSLNLNEIDFGNISLNIPSNTEGDIENNITPQATNAKTNVHTLDDDVVDDNSNISDYDEKMFIGSKKIRDHIKNDSNTDWYNQREYIIFKNELKGVKRSNVFVLKECKENKRLLDLKYDDLNTTINNVQTSVIFFSTISGFLQATQQHFQISETVVTVCSIFIATYISLILSISKYFKFDELKEKIHNLREKYSLLHNKIEYRMDMIGPWSCKELWEYQDAAAKLEEWDKVKKYMEEDYNIIIESKQSLFTEYEIIMDTKSRNQYYIKNRKLNYNNREVIYALDQKEQALEKRITSNPSSRRTSIKLQHEELDNWDSAESD
tara:strand:+ start:2887 stop:3870 length:984 start_codon:yes stop_codon:yes gene_type:complete